jgi:molybdopterin molybdotransferase
VGERDVVKQIFEELGVTFAFRTVALRPAKPSAFGVRGDVRIAVLPGNPAAAFVAFHEFVRPAVLALAGRRDAFLPRIIAHLDGTIRAKPERTFVAFASLRVTVDGFVAIPLANQCSSLTRTTAEACGFIVVPPGTQTYSRGDRIDFDVVDWTKIA